MQFTPPSRFGKDHWSLLAYVETCCVDGQNGIGTLDKRRMRCNEHTHPLLKGGYAPTGWKPSYGTRLAGFFEFADRADTEKAVAAGLQMLGHDDWDCLDDLQAAGYVDILTLANGAVRVLPLGIRVAAMLREHKANGGMFAGFHLPDLDITARSN